MSQHNQYWINSVLDKSERIEARLFALGMAFGKAWTNTEQGYDFWKSQFDRIKSGKELTAKARKALKELMA